MDLLLKRTTKLEDRTLGELYINGTYFCDTLEDKDRGLSQSLSLEENKALKVYGETAIPTGTYVVNISFSNAFQKFLPELMYVPAYVGIRIHNGVVPAHSKGCILVGKKTKEGKSLWASKTTLASLLKVLNAVNKKEKITITIL